MECTVHIDGQPLSFSLEGNFFWGKDEILHNPQETVIKNTSWKNVGYSILNLLTNDEYLQLVNSMERTIKNLFNEFSVAYKQDDFKLIDYHKYVDSNLHQKIISNTRFLTYSDLNIDLKNILGRISNQIGCEVCAENPLLDKEIVILRISRPKTLDINPAHRDGYLDIWKNTLNLWLPITGCNKNSSLPVIPESHLWNEKDILRTSSKGASIHGLAYRVPGIAKTNYGLKMIRPNPELGQVLVFTPFLIHGCAVNWNEDTTRFSLELRLFNKEMILK